MRTLLLIATTILLTASSNGEETVYKDKVNLLKEKILRMRSEVLQLKESNAQVRKEITEMKAIVEERNINKRQLQHQHKVAFTASLSPGQIQHLGDHVTLIFDNVITNTTTDYSTLSGRFTAPVSGTYLFVAGIQCTYHHLSTFEFVRDGVSLLPVHCDSRGMDGVEATGRTVAVHLLKGHQLWFRTTDDNHVENSIWGHGFSDITGFLLFED